jgi:hypothetical protein
LFEFVNLNHFRKNVPTLILDGRNVGNGDGFPSHHRPAGDYSEEAPTPPVRGFFFWGIEFLSFTLRLAIARVDNSTTRPARSALPVLQRRVLPARRLSAYFCR